MPQRAGQLAALGTDGCLVGGPGSRRRAEGMVAIEGRPHPGRHEGWESGCRRSSLVFTEKAGFASRGVLQFARGRRRGYSTGCRNVFQVWTLGPLCPGLPGLPLSSTASRCSGSSSSTDSSVGGPQPRPDEGPLRTPFAAEDPARASPSPAAFAATPSALLPFTVSESAGPHVNAGDGLASRTYSKSFLFR
ncbi:unnamed protein product [Lampetra planeri]